MRDHNPVTIEEFNGLWARGGVDSCPADHFTDCNNIAYIQSGYETRPGVDTYSATPNPIRMYEFNSGTNALEGLLVLNNLGEIHHVIGAIDFLVMTIATMTDFGFLEYNGRAYISPSTKTNLNGLLNEKVWVYLGDGSTVARPAAGDPPVDADGVMTSAVSATVGNVESGIHIFAVVYETDTGYLTSIGPDTLTPLTCPGGFSVDLATIPISPNTYVTKRHIVATKSIDPASYTGDVRGYQFFFVPDGVIPDNTTTTAVVSFFDSELLEDASHLIDNFASIPAGGGLGLYHNRMLVWDTATDISIVLVSAPGEPEAISQVDGLVLLPSQGEGISHCAEYRDVLYIFKVNSTSATADNGDVPSSWPVQVIDQGIGAAKHGIAIVGMFGSINIEYLIIMNYSGIFIFNGTYTRPELSWKIKDFWISFTQFEIALLSEIYNDPLHQIIFVNIPSMQMILIGDYANALNPKDIRWGKWTFNVQPTTMSLIGKDNVLLIGAGQVIP